MSRQVIWPRIPRSWLAKLDDEVSDLVGTNGIESWITQELLTVCARLKSVSEQDHCQIAVMAIAVGDVSAVHTLECAHRRQILATRALNQRSLLVRGLPFPRTVTVGDVYIDVFVICSTLHFLDVYVRQSELSRRMLCLISFYMTPRWHFGHARIPPERRVSVMLITLLMAVVVGNRPDSLATLPGEGAFALALRREVFASLDVSCTATATLPPCRRCQAKGALLDKLLRVTGLALLLQTNSSVKPCAKFYATDPSLRLRGIHHRSGMALLVRLAAPLA